ncbi:MAG: hypothetical protein GX591_04465 [Planctomycetes bacterium]|nr:hypothetical protein [Planctomycetota bacterium]
MPVVEHEIPAAPVTGGPGQYYFGYYNVSPWDASGRYLLALEADFFDRPQRPDDAARIGLIDTRDGNAWRTLGRTRAWNWQQACMLQWVGPAWDRGILYNDLDGGRVVTRLLDAFSGDCRTLPLGTYCLSRDGTQAISLNFGRVHVTRPGYGYVTAPNPTAGRLRPADDGLWRMDMTTGEHRLILSLAQLAELEPKATMDGAIHWVNHMQFNTDDTRFAFLHRWKRPDTGGPWTTRLLTADPDGSDVRIVVDDGVMSHFDWKDGRRITGWGIAGAVSPDRHYYTWDERDGSAEPLGTDVLDCDGHCSFSPDRRWMLTDSYPRGDSHRRELILYRMADNTKVVIGRFYSPPDTAGEIRCDLHPRWDRTGTRVCFDSLHEGRRRMYVADVREVVA